MRITRRKADQPSTANWWAHPKVRELWGLVLLTVGLLFAISLASHHPTDPSFLRQATGEAEPVRNLIGPVGANVSALALGFLGLAALLVPLLLIVAGFRRLRPGERRGPVLGRGLGAVVLFASLPPLLDLVLAPVDWRGEALAPGGAFGLVFAEALETRLNVAGSVLVLLAAVVIGSTLLVQSTVGELLGAWNRALRTALERGRLAWARARERRQKERARRRVVAKHLRRAAEEREEEPTAAGDEPPAPDLPLRVTERLGGPGSGLRKLSTAERLAPPPPPRPQSDLPFPDTPAAKRRLPPLNLLHLEQEKSPVEESELVRLGEVIRSRCVEFGVEGTVEAITPGPVITVYEFQPAPGVKVSQIVNLQDDLALALKAESVRIDRIPGRSTLGIEVPNKHRSTIRLGPLLAHDGFKRSPSKLTMALGLTLHGEPYYADLATMPHLLVAGATGSGKSVGLQTMVTSLVYKATRDEVQFIFIDPKRIELGVYADIPHLKAEVVVEPKKAANALRWAVAEMERRYRLLAELHVRSIDYYNRAIRDPETQRRLALSDRESELRQEDLKPLPYYVIVIDELADLMMVASGDVEAAVARLAQMARAVGIHLIVATQRPSVDVLTGTIKANFPCRISYATATRHDSRTILDQVGAEKLLGQGDMLFMPPGTARSFRLHGAYISEQETAALVRWLKRQGEPELDPEVLSPKEPDRRAGEGGEEDDLYDEAVRLVVAEKQASASFLQRRMRVGFSRAARLIDIMERDGILGPAQGSKPRQVLVKPEHLEQLDPVRDD